MSTRSSCSAYRSGRGIWTLRSRTSKRRSSSSPISSRRTAMPGWPVPRAVSPLAPRRCCRRGLQVCRPRQTSTSCSATSSRLPGKPTAPSSHYRRGVGVRQDHVEAHSNIAVVLRSWGNSIRPRLHLQRVAAFRPAEFDAHFQYGVALLASGASTSDREPSPGGRASIRSQRAACRAWAGVLAAQGLSDEAIAHYRRAIAADKAHYFAYAGLGVELNEQGRPTEAVESLRQALLLNPAGIESHSRMLFLMSFLAEPIEYARGTPLWERLQGASPEPCRREVVQTAASRATLRVGLVSGDFRNHPVSAFLESVLAHLDREKVEVHGYTTTRRDDEVTARFAAPLRAWFSIVGMHDEAAARRIHEDGIDVLIDLAGHTGHNRLSVFAWRPAPVQVTWLGYLASTGLPSMDYVLADRVSLPEEDQGQFVEQAWYMPNSLYCFTPPSPSPAVGPLPALCSGRVTFGSFQRMNKISDATLEASGPNLQCVPSARLRLQMQADGGSAVAGPVRRAATAVRHPDERVALAGPVPDRVAVSRAATIKSISCWIPSRILASRPPAKRCGWASRQ